MRRLLVTASALALIAAAAPFVASGGAAHAQTSSGATNNTYSTNPADIPGHRGNANSPMGTTPMSRSTAARASLSKEDRSFARTAAEGGMGEVELGQLAQQRASSPEVKQFGERMATDHQKANAQLESIMSSKGMTAPKSMESEQKKLQARLEKASGATFDREYIHNMVQDHQKDIKLFQREAQNGQDPDLRSFAQQTLPTLQDHLQLAQQTQSQLSPAMTSRSSGNMTGRSGSSMAPPSSSTTTPR